MGQTVYDLLKYRRLGWILFIPAVKSRVLRTKPTLISSSRLSLRSFK